MGQTDRGKENCKERKDITHRGTFIMGKGELEGQEREGKVLQRGEQTGGTGEGGKGREENCMDGNIVFRCDSDKNSLVIISYV